jgi:hypothetical protein
MKQTRILRSNTIDKFNTNQDVANLCIEYIKKYVIPDDFDLIIEPNAGDGAFIAGCKSLTYKQHFYDIETEHEEKIMHDFLHLWTFKMPILVFIIFVFSYLIFLNIIFLSIICPI